MAKKEKSQQLLYYGAFEEFRKLTVAHKSSATARRAAMKSNTAEDKLCTVRYKCHIETDWIEKIEQSLSHFDAAIREDRQFIRQEGEIVPIEKAKRVSKSSVEHLAKHSNLITHVPEDDGRLIPDKIYMVENLSNYAIYENRFLYMALRYVNDFVTSRLDAVEKAWRRFQGELSIRKNAVIGKRNIACSVELRETTRLDEELVFDEEVTKAVERLRSILHFTSVLLATPLMQELAKAPLLSPPITKTNILRMNIHFKATVEVYEYLAAYAGAGYTVEEIKTSATPFSEEVSDEVSEIILLCSFLTYKHGGFGAELLEAYRLEKEQERLRALEKTQKELQELRRRIAEKGESPESYMLLLEKQNAELFADSEALRTLREEHAALEERCAAALETVEEQKAAIEKLEKKLSCSEADLSTARTAAAEEIERLREDLKKKTEALKEKEKEAAEAKNAAEEAEKLIPEGAKTETKKTVTATDIMMEAAGGDYEKLYHIMKARYDSLSRKTGNAPTRVDYTTEDAMNELETEFEAFRSLFNKEWANTKKKIRKEILWSKKKPSDKPKKAKGAEAKSDNKDDSAT